MLKFLIGLGLGAIVGLSFDENDKHDIEEFLKRKICRAPVGRCSQEIDGTERWKQWEKERKNYAEYKNYKSTHAEKNEDADSPEMETYKDPSFDNFKESRVFFEMFKNWNDPKLSVNQMYQLLGRESDHTWDGYGWTKEQLNSMEEDKCFYVKHSVKDGSVQWVLKMPKFQSFKDVNDL